MKLITGGTGLLGSHIAEQLVTRGDAVRAIVRDRSDTRFLQSIGVELHRTDLADRDSLRKGMAGVEVVYHSASKVGDWGSWDDFERDTLRATQNVLDSATAAGVRRVVLISSTSAYGHPPPSKTPITEDHPLGNRFWIWDHYTRAKVIAERMAWRHAVRTGLPITAIRPSWLYGPRDRTSIFRIARSLGLGRVRIIGDGSNRINSVYAGNVAEAAIQAADHPAAAGQAYNITNDGLITQQDYLNLFADALGFSRPSRHVAYRAAFAGAFMLEAAFRFARSQRPPFVTRYAVWLLGRETVYSTEKAERELRWRPRVGYEDGVRRTVEWVRRHGT